MEVHLSRLLLELDVLGNRELADVKPRAELHLFRVLRTASVVVGQDLRAATYFSETESQCIVALQSVAMHMLSIRHNTRKRSPVKPTSPIN